MTIGETLADPDNPVALPAITVDEPSLAMTIGINTSPLNGSEGDKLTARQLRSRLDAELIGNVSLRVLPTERPDAWEVQGRGELQLAVLVEQMRREGFELTVGKPQVVTREVDGKVHEPVERVAIDVPEDYLGVVTQLLALRKGRLDNMVNHGTGWVRMEYVVPARGLIGFRTEFMTETRGTGILHHVFEGYEPWFGELKTRPNGSMVADRRGDTRAFALMALQERGQLLVGPGVEVYEGMIVGENARADEMDVNPTKEKKLTNMRSSSSDDTVRLTPPRPMSLEQALEFIADDECVEVTPQSVRLRKVILDQATRGRLRNSKKPRAETHARADGQRRRRASRMRRGDLVRPVRSRAGRRPRALPPPGRPVQRGACRERRGPRPDHPGAVRPRRRRRRGRAAAELRLRRQRAASATARSSTTARSSSTAPRSRSAPTCRSARTCSCSPRRTRSTPPLRRTKVESAAPIVIHDGVWLGGRRDRVSRA